MRRDATGAGHRVFRPSHGRPVAYRDLPGPPGAPTVVLLHGIGVTADLNWGASLATLRSRFRVIAPDLPGHGRSGGPAPDFRLETCADDIAELTTALGIDRFLAVGYSMGSLVAQLLWHRHPDLTDGLVLCASARNFLGTIAERTISLFSPAVAIAARFNPLLHVMGAAPLAPQLISGLTGQRRTFAVEEMNRTSMATVAAALVAVSEFTSHDWIGQIDIPVSVLVPTHDTVVAPARQRRLAEAIPHATVVTVDGDHAVFASDPDRFTATLLEVCLAMQADISFPCRSAIARRSPGVPRTAADAG
ncbi:alpha/beta fold hydrolase [Mycolicibacterium sp.]|uniref:alpha/beta fold hydrolase n=1 Tax=Mycolicibacterium sp. TaxID=2320850 RepID=UPI0037C5BA1F